MVDLERAYDLTKKLTTSKDSSTGHQNRIGVILATQGEILNNAKNTTPEDRRRGLEKQLEALGIYRRLAKTAAGTGLRRLVETLFSLADTFESLELHVKSQGAMQEARSLVERKPHTKILRHPFTNTNKGLPVLKRPRMPEEFETSAPPPCMWEARSVCTVY